MRLPKLFTNLILLVALAIVAFIFPTTAVGAEGAAEALRNPRRTSLRSRVLAALLIRKLDVADLTFHASKTPNANGDAYALTFKAEVTSKGFFARLFNLKFKETVESIVEPLTFTVKKTTILDEQGKRVRETHSTFDSAKGQMTWTLRDPNNPPANHGRPSPSFPDNSKTSSPQFISSVRNHSKSARASTSHIGDGGRVYTIPVKVGAEANENCARHESMRSESSAELFGPERLIDDEKGEFSIWFTADSRHIPVGGKAKPTTVLSTSS